MHAAAATGLVLATPYRAPAKAKPELPVVMSMDIRPEPPEFTSPSRDFFTEPPAPEPEAEPLRLPDCPSDLPPIDLPVELPTSGTDPRTALPPHDPALVAGALVPESPPPSAEPVPACIRPEIAEPQPLPGNPPPRYPAAARRLGIEGTVTVRLELSPTGKVIVACVQESSGSPLLDSAALDALRKWQFGPLAALAESPRAVTVPVTFVLRSAG
jgi:protein TonB